jgi:hypothetical protein
MNDQIPPTPKALQEALELSADLLADIELSRVVPMVAALKASRLARLLNDFDHQQLFRYEAGGYPSSSDGIPPEVWRLAELAGRTYEEKDPKSGKIKTVAYTESVDHLGERIDTEKLALSAAADRDISVTSANPHQFVMTPAGNSMERRIILNEIAAATKRLASRRTYIYDYALRRHYELKFSGIAEDVFSHIRNAVDGRIGELVPAALQQFAAVHDNLQSANPEDWANAVHSCRRIMQAVADAVFPPSSESRVKEMAKGRTEIKLGKENYVNRLVCYAEARSASQRFSDLVGSHLGFLGDRLDAVFSASQKGSHAVVTRDEAHRYVVYTYMIVGDILSLQPAEKVGPANGQSQRSESANSTTPD